MLDFIWGLKVDSMFDAWSIDHFINGISLGTVVLIFNGKNLGSLFGTLNQQQFPLKVINKLKRQYDIFLVLLLSFSWEAFEHYLETGLAGKTVAYWFQGVEFWPNRLLADPLLLVLGYLVVKKWPRLVWPARAFSLTWLVIHIFVFPHSMYLHEIF